jgi:spoIIIJ-associated protein
VSELRQEGYPSPLTEDASEPGPEDPATGPEDPGPEAGAGLVPDEPSEPDGGPVDQAGRESPDGESDRAGIEDLDGDDEADSDDESDAEDEENPLDTEAEIAADYLEELLDIADLDGDIDTYIEGDRAHVSIVSESEILVGTNGEVLDALQELARLAVMSETGGRSRLMLDVAGYRERRRKELISLTNDAVREARETNERVPLAPMNPFERKIVHDAVVLAGLTSASEGEEPKRHVVIHPA